MDCKVYRKEEVLQPSGSEWVFVPNIIDFEPVIEERDGKEVIMGVKELEDASKDLTEQECSLATIFQRGLDPLDKEDGIQWSEALLGEVTAIQLIEEITEAVARVTTSVEVVFDTVEDANGNSFLTYTLHEVA